MASEKPSRAGEPSRQPLDERPLPPLPNDEPDKSASTSDSGSNANQQRVEQDVQPADGNASVGQVNGTKASGRLNPESVKQRIHKIASK